MRRAHLIGFLMASSLLVPACGPSPSVVQPRSTVAKPSTQRPPTDSTGTTGTTDQPSTDPGATKPYFGLVLDESGKPVAGVPIVGYLISNNGGGVVSNNGSGLLSNNGGGLVSDKGSSYKLMDTSLTATTDAQGHFTLTNAQGAINIEADQSDSEKAIAFNVASDATGIQLHLAPTGSISGKVTASKAPSVTHFIGVQVFVPGTGYEAATADDGSFTISHVPVGTYALYATKHGLGSATVGDVTVASNKTASATLDLAVTQPAIASLTPDVTVAGGKITITGSNFGASDGATFSVSVGGAVVSNPTRVDDQTIKVTIPSGASSGDVNVTVGGIQSNSVPIKLATTILLTEPATGFLVGGKEQLSVTALDATGKPVAIQPSDVQWSSDNAAIQVDANGLVTAKSAGSATITAGNNSVVDHFKLTAYAGPAAVVTYQGGNPNDSNFNGFMSVDAIACDANGNFFIADSGAPALYRYTPPGFGSTYWDDSNSQVVTTEFAGLALDGSGNAYLSDQLNNRIYKVTPDGKGSVFAGPSDAQLAGGNGASGTSDGQGNTARFNRPEDLVFGQDGKLYVADSANNAIRVIAADGTVSTLTTSQTLKVPVGLALDPNGNLLVACTGDDTLQRVSTQGAVSQVTTSVGVDASPIVDAVSDAQGKIYAVCAPPDSTQCNTSATISRVYTVDSNGKLQPFAGSTFGSVDGDLSTATFGPLLRIALTPDGNLLLEDTGNPNNGCTPKLREILLHP